MSRTDLKWAIRDDAYVYRDKPFKLKNGTQTHHYLDCRRMLLRPEDLRRAAKVVAGVIHANWEVKCVAGVLTGAAPLVAALSLLEGWPGIWVREARKKHGTQTRVEMASRLSHHDLAKTVLIDDVSTSGRTLMDAVSILRENGCCIVGCVTLVDRGFGSREHLEEMDVPYCSVFTMDDIQFLPETD
jgi:orotate phosphoribosyltransferase